MYISREGIPVFQDIPPDAIYSGIAACGGVRGYYNHCLRDASLRVAAPYPANTHEVIEGAVTAVQKKRLNLVNDLIAANLVTPLPNWWAIPSLRRATVGEAGRAHRTMVPDSRGERFVLQRGGKSWPIYCTWANFSFDIRELATGERVGAPLDTSHAAQATYLVNEASEDQAWNGLTDEQGSTMTIDGMTAPGLLSSTTTFSYADMTTLTGAQIRAVIAGAIQSLRITHPGPFTVYYPGNYDTKFNEPYSTAYDAGTVRQQIETMGPYGGRTVQVKLSDTLPDHRVVVVQMDPDAVDVVVGQQPVPVSWKDGPGWHTFWVVLACVIVRMFANINGKYGVAVGNTA